MTASSAARSSDDPGSLSFRASDHLLMLIERTLQATRWRLAFPAELEARFEAETGHRRVRHLRRATLIGLAVFHLYAWAAYVTTPNLATLNLAFRIGLVTPMAVAIFVALSRVRARMREALCGLGVLAATMIPAGTLWLGQGPNLAHATTAIWLTVIFANISLALRFTWACIVSGTAALLGGLAIAAHPEIAPDLADLIRLDMLIGIAFSLAAAHKIESANRRNYLYTLRESLRAQQLVVANARLMRLSTTDPLTGLANRRAFSERLDALWQASRDGDPFALMLVDVDHFKRFNDHYGHGAGDACLCAVSRLLTARAGSAADLVARYGGEEFALLLPGLDSEAAIALAERTRLSLNTLALPHAGRGDGLDHVTVSVGVATSRDGAATPTALFEAADEALYRAKSAGRNRTGSARHRPEADPGPQAALAAWPAGGTPALRRTA
ncbi:diguanylate cyclase domain-containing protein [Methylobacterium sp. M6A4_1b]